MSCVGKGRGSEACRGQGLALRRTPGHASGIILRRMDDPQPLMVRGKMEIKSLDLFTMRAASGEIHLPGPVCQL